MTIPSKCVVDILTVAMAVILFSSFIQVSSGSMFLTSVDEVAVFSGTNFYLVLFQRKVYPILIWIIYQAFIIAWEVTFTLFYPPPSITIRLVLWFFSIASYIFVCINVGEMWAIKLAGQPSSPKQCFQQDTAPAYKDVGPSCVHMELEVASRQDESPPPYVPYMYYRNCPL